MGRSIASQARGLIEASYEVFGRLAPGTDPLPPSHDDVDEVWAWSGEAGQPRSSIRRRRVRPEYAEQRGWPAEDLLHVGADSPWWAEVPESIIH